MLREGEGRGGGGEDVDYLEMVGIISKRSVILSSLEAGSDKCSPFSVEAKREQTSFRCRDELLPARLKFLLPGRF